MLLSITEEQRQLFILALVELKLRRPGWGTMIDEIVDEALLGYWMRTELERLHAEPPAAPNDAGQGVG
jgi:hypothetical protein